MADPNEPAFSPHFEDYKVSPCVADARADYDDILSREDEVERLREVRPWSAWKRGIRDHVAYTLTLLHPRTHAPMCPRTSD